MLDEQAATELDLYVENNEPIYRHRLVPMYKNLINKMAQGKYDSAKAVKMFMYAADEGAKKYAKEFDHPSNWNKMFSVATRKHVATAMRNHFEVEAKLGNYNEYLTKASIAKMKKPSNANRSAGRKEKQFVIKRDGKEVARVNDSQVLAWFHKHHSYSMDHAIKYEGYSVEPVGSRNRSGTTKPRPLGSDRDKYHGNPNARRNKSGSKVPNTHAWADGFGTWHVRISRGAASPLIAARKVLRDEITARQDDVADFVWKKPVRVQSLDDAETVVYREGDGSHVKRNPNQRNAKTPNQRARSRR